MNLPGSLGLACGADREPYVVRLVAGFAAPCGIGAFSTSVVPADSALSRDESQAAGFLRGRGLRAVGRDHRVRSLLANVFLMVFFSFALMLLEIPRRLSLGVSDVETCWSARGDRRERQRHLRLIRVRLRHLRERLFVSPSIRHHMHLICTLSLPGRYCGMFSIVRGYASGAAREPYIVGLLEWRLQRRGELGAVLALARAQSLALADAPSPALPLEQPQALALERTAA